MQGRPLELGVGVGLVQGLTRVRVLALALVQGLPLGLPLALVQGLPLGLPLLLLRLLIPVRSTMNPSCCQDGEPSGRKTTERCEGWLCFVSCPFGCCGVPPLL